MSGVLHGSLLGPLLLLIYINDLDDNITSNAMKFADDTKVFRKIKTDSDKQHLQNDLDKLVKWSEKWQMLLKFGKCKCLYAGHGYLEQYLPYYSLYPSFRVLHIGIYMSPNLITSGYKL